MTDEADQTPIYAETVAATGVDPQQYWDQIAAEVQAIQEEFTRVLRPPAK